MHFAGDGVRFLDLPENLRLADDERIEAGGDAKQVSRRFEVGHVVDVRRHRRLVDRVELADEAHQVRQRRGHVVAGDVHFRAVAGGEHDRLARRAARRERLQRAVDAAHLEIEALAQFDRRGLVADSDQ